MPSLPAQCTHCGLTWTPRAFNFGEGVTLISVGSTTNCPRCGSVARILDGQYSVRDGLIEVLSAPDWSMQALRRLRRAAEEAEALAATNPEAAISLVEKVSGRAGALLRRANAVEQSKEMGGLKAILKWIAYAVGGVLALKASAHANLTAEEIARLVDEALRHVTG